MTSRLHKLPPLLALVLALTACGDAAPDRPQAPAATVTTAAVETKPWSDAIEALGTARANESVLVTAKVTETVVRVNFEDGDLVEAGDVLVDLSGRAEVAGLEEAAAAYREAQKQYQRLQQLTAQKLIPTSQLDAQRNELVEANRQLDVRRRFTEAVLGGVSAGVIGVDEDDRINLPNPSASHLLFTDLDRMIGEPFTQVVPEMAPLFEAGIDGVAVISALKKGDLETIARGFLALEDI